MGCCASTETHPPLVARLLREGLTEAEIVRDNWIALVPFMSKELVAVVFQHQGEKIITWKDNEWGQLDEYDQLSSDASLQQVDLLVVKPSTPKSCDLWCLALGRYALIEPSRVKYSTAAVRDALLAASELATSCTWWCFALNNFTGELKNRWMFSEQPRLLYDVVLRMSTTVNSPISCFHWCYTINHLTANHLENIVVFGTPAVRDALVSVSKFVGEDGVACEAWCRVITHIACEDQAPPENMALYATDAVRAALQSIRCATANNNDALLKWNEAVEIANKPPGQTVKVNEGVTW